MLRDLVRGGTGVAITAKSAAVALRSIRPASICERTRKELAQDVVKELRSADASLADIEMRMVTASLSSEIRAQTTDDLAELDSKAGEPFT